MARILEQLPGLEMVSVRRGPVTGQGGAEYTVVIEKFPALPVENNLWNHDGEHGAARRGGARHGAAHTTHTTHALPTTIYVCR